MSVINDYLSGLKKQYPHSQAVNEQLEELRDTLHMKTEEYQSHGLNYDAAAKAAISSLGVVTPLLDEVSGNVKNVYVNRLNKSNTVFCTLIMLVEFMMAWLGYSLATNQSIPIDYFSISLLTLAVGLGLWLIIAVIQFRKDPLRISIVEMPFRKVVLLAIFGWLAISICLIAANYITGAPYWFPLPVIGISTWPINVIVYHRQLMGGRYDAA